MIVFRTLMLSFLTIETILIAVPGVLIRGRGFSMSTAQLEQSKS